MKKNFAKFLVATVLMIPITTAKADDEIIVKSGGLSVVDTVAKLEAIIRTSPAKLIAKIDHGANASNAGLELGQSVLLILGSPTGGTPIMQENRLAGLDLPAKILVYEDNGQTYIAYTDPEEIEDRYDLDDVDAELDQMANVLNRFTDEAVK